MYCLWMEAHLLLVDGVTCIAHGWRHMYCLWMETQVLLVRFKALPIVVMLHTLVFCYAGEVIRGLDIAVGQMHRGEVAVITCKPDYAYGTVGVPPHVPPHSAVIFEIELINWKSAYFLLVCYF